MPSQFLDYTINTVSFQCHTAETGEKLYLKGQYFALALAANERSIWCRNFLANLPEADYLYLKKDHDVDPEDNNPRNAYACVVGLFFANRAMLPEDPGQKIDFLKALTLQEKDRMICGYATAALPSKNGHRVILNGSYIQPAHRGQKLSRLLMQSRLDWAIDDKRKIAVSTPHAKNAASIAVCQAFGFKNKYANEPERIYMKFELDLNAYHHGLQQNNLRI